MLTMRVTYLKVLIPHEIKSFSNFLYSARSLATKISGNLSTIQIIPAFLGRY